MTFEQWWGSLRRVEANKRAYKAVWSDAQAEMRERCAEEFNRLWSAGTPLHKIADILRALEIE